MQDTVLERLMALATDALAELESPTGSVSAAIRKALRIARLRNDHEAVFWLSLELISPQNKEAKSELLRELSPRVERSELQQANSRYSALLLEERECKTLPKQARPGADKILQDAVMMLPVGEIESRIASLRRSEADPPPPANMHPLDVAFFRREWEGDRGEIRVQLLQFEAVVDRIRQRIHAYVSRVEKELAFGQLNADIFERNRRLVDERLVGLDPDALATLVGAYRSVHAGDAEARAQGLLSCRRVLKALADVVYPARAEPVQGADGKMHDVSDEKYIARLWQYVSDQIGNNTAGRVVLANLQDLGRRIDAVYQLSNKGVHSNVNQGEADQALIQTYLLIGDILRLADKSSAAVGPASASA